MAFRSAMTIPGTVVLDVRTPQEYASGHIPGAVNIDVSASDFAARVAALDRSTPYAVYCRTGNRSSAALTQMADLGFTQAYHLGGGIQAWADASGPIITP